MTSPAAGVPAVAELEPEAPPAWRNPVPFLWLAIVMLLTAAIAALASGAAEASDDGGDGEARSRIVAAAGSATEGDFAFSMSMAFESSKHEFLADVSHTMEGRYDADTQRMRSRSTGTASPGFEMEHIVDGSVHYVRFPGGGVFADATGGKPWGRIDHPERPGSGNVAGLTTNPLARLDDLGRLRSAVVRVGEETVRGVACVRYRTTMDVDGEGDAALHVWVGDDERLCRYVVRGRYDGTTSTITFEVFDVGTPVSIEVPPVDQVGPYVPPTFPRPTTTADGD